MIRKWHWRKSAHFTLRFWSFGFTLNFADWCVAFDLGPLHLWVGRDDYYTSEDEA